MGTWGTSIFSDDLALDVKGAFKDKIAFGQSAVDATAELLIEYNDVIEDSDESCVFWLALSLVQWQLGRLQENVKNKSLEIIKTGKDLERWKENPKEFKKRKAVLEKLKVQLLSKQPVAKKIPIPFVSNTKMQVGDVLSYRHPSGNFAMLKVLGIKEDNCGDRYPQIEILDHFGESIPDKKKINTIKRKYKKDDEEEQRNTILKPSGTYYIAPYGKRDAEPWGNLHIIERKIEVKTKIRNKGTVALIWWRDFDNFLNELFE